jgi:hypothetical protein
MKHKKLKISLISAAVAILMLMASLTVYAYFTTRVYVYTADGKEVAHVGMNLQLLFGKRHAVNQGGRLANGKNLFFQRFKIHISVFVNTVTGHIHKLVRVRLLGIGIVSTRAIL